MVPVDPEYPNPTALKKCRATYYSLVLILFVFHLNVSYAQDCLPGFNFPEEVCLNENIRLENTTSCSGIFEWDFCEGDLLQNSAEIVSIVDAGLATPIGTALEKSGNNWFGFIVNATGNSLTRVDFGEDLLNPTPTVVNLGNLGGLLDGPQDIKIINHSGDYYAFIYNRSTNKLVRINFGSDLDATLVSSDILVTGAGYQNGGLDVAFDGNNWVATLSNSNTLTLVNLGTSPTGIPSAVQVMNTSVIPEITAIGDVEFVKDGNDWYGFVVGFSSKTIHRLSFGENLFSNPTSTRLTIPELSAFQPYDITVEKDQGRWVVFSATRSGNLIRAELGNLITNNTPTYTDLGKFGSLVNTLKLAVVRENSRWVGLAANFNSKQFYLIHFSEGECGFNRTYSNDPDRVLLQAQKSGVHAVTLHNTTNNGEQTSITNTIEVLEQEAPKVEIIAEGVHCISNELFLTIANTTPDIGVSSYIWTFPDGSQQTGPEASQTFLEPGSYLITLSVEGEAGCANFTEKEVIVYPSPSASFSLSTSEICSNSAVSFENTTGYVADSIITYSWDFGDGTTSDEKSPVHTYVSAGTYEVTLVVSIPGCESISNQTINVQAGPQTYFTAADACIGDAVSFENLSIDEHVSNWEWDFGDGIISLDQHPAAHIYSEGGVYKVILKAANTLGCETFFEREIHIYAVPEPDFSNSQACANSTVRFTDETQSEGIVNWEWTIEMPDGSKFSTNEQNPEVVFKDAGAYEVSLRVTLEAGCSNTSSKIVDVSPSPVIEMDVEVGCAGSPTIFRDITDADGQTIISRLWRIEGHTFEENNVSYNFAEAGSYEVSLILYLENGCIVEEVRQIRIEGLADFIIPENACTNENIILESASSCSVFTEWDFCEGDLLQNTAQVVTRDYAGFDTPIGTALIKSKNKWHGFIVNATGNSLSRIDFGDDLLNSSPTIVNLGNLGGLLDGPQDIKVVESNNAYYAFIYNRNTNKLIRINFGSNIESVTATSDILLTGGGFLNGGLDVAYDGINWVASISNSNSLTLVNLGNSPSGIPTASQVINTATIPEINAIGDVEFLNDGKNWYGFVAGFNSRTIHRLSFGESLFKNPVATKLNIPELASFQPYGLTVERDKESWVILTSTRGGELIRAELGSSIVNNTPIYSMLGKFGVLVNTLKISMERSGSRWVALTTNFSAKQMYVVQFSEGDCGFDLSYSDETVKVQLQSKRSGVHHVTKYGKSSSGLISSVTKTIEINDQQAPQAVILDDENACLTNPNTFAYQNLTPGQTITAHTWTFPDGSIQTGEEASFQFAEPGTYKVRLNIESENSCGNFVEKEVTIYPEPQAAYSLSAELVCSNAPIRFTNLTDFPEESVISYAWDFKDGSSSNEKSPQHTFESAGTYLVELQASIPGCISSVTQTVTVESGPQTLFAAPSVCNNETVAFENKTTGEDIEGFRWDLGDGTFAQVENPFHVYDGPGTYLVRLESENSLGCVTSFTQTVRVYSNPLPDFTVSPACAGSTVYFTDATQDADGNIVGWEWEVKLKDGSLVKIGEQNPSFTFAEAGSYEVSLSATTTWNCANMIRKTIEVVPVPEVAIRLEGGCIGMPSVLSDESIMGDNIVQSWFWKIGDEVFTTRKVDFTFQAEGTYLVFLQLNLQSGCSVSGSREVKIEPLPAVDFSFNGACEGQTALFEAAVTAGEYVWDIEGKTIVTEGKKLEYTFTQAGTYTIGLTVQDAKGCFNTVVQEIEVGQGPVAAFEPDRFKGVPPFKVNFTNLSETAIAYRWFFGDPSNSSSMEENPVFTFSDIGEYKVQLIALNEAGCSDTVEQIISVVDPAYDVALQDVHLIRQGNQIQIVLALQNAGTIIVSDMDIEVKINDDYTLSEKYTGTLEIGQAENYSLNMQLRESSGRKISFVCVTLKPVLSLVEREFSEDNNEKCISFDQRFVLQEPYPNPVNDRVVLQFVLPKAGIIDFDVYSSQGIMVESVHLPNRQAGYNSHELWIAEWGKGIYFVRARFDGEEKSYRLMKY